MMSLKPFTTFWQQKPALLIGIFLFLGASFALQPSWLVCIPLAALFLPPSRSTGLALLIGVGGYLYTLNTVLIPHDGEIWQGIARVEVVEMKEEIKFSKPLTKMKLHIERFCEGETLLAKGMQASYIMKGERTRLSPGVLYEIKGTLKRSSENWFSFSFKEGESRIIEKRPSFVEWRFEMKKRLRYFLEQKLPSGTARTFLEGLFIGEFHDPLLAENLRRFGLSHIMVVSGFHFSLMAAFLAFFLRFTLPWKASIVALVLGATFYLLFIGPTASVMRAWISITALFMGKFFEKKANGLNSLGVGLVALLLYEPTWCQSLGFQLSFLATFAILLFYAPVDAFLSTIFKTRSFSSAKEFSFLDQLLYMLLIFFRKSFSLSFAVNLLMVPMSLFYFHQFPLLSVLYNIFFPLITSIALFLLCMALLLSWVPVLSTALFWASFALADALLHPVNFLPHSFDVMLAVQEMPATSLVLFLTAVSVGGIMLHKREESGLLQYA